MLQYITHPVGGINTRGMAILEGFVCFVENETNVGEILPDAIGNGGATIYMAQSNTGIACGNYE
jgi:hypothetical protein